MVVVEQVVLYLLLVVHLVHFKLAISSSGDPGFGGTSNSGSGFITTSSANSNSLFTGHNSGTRFIRTQWQHTPSNKDGTGAYTLTLTNNSVGATITGSITFSGGGGGFGLCIYENIPVNLKEGTANIHDLNIGDMIMSYNWETGQEEEVEILQIEKRLHDNLYKIMLSDPNDETEGEELKELILTQDHPVYKQDGSMVSDDPDTAKTNYDLDTVGIQPNDLLKILDGKYYAQVHRLEGFPKKHWTYTILTKNNNFYANGVLVHSEIGIKMYGKRKGMGSKPKRKRNMKKTRQGNGRGTKKSIGAKNNGSR